MKKRLFVITAIILIYSLTATPNTFASDNDDTQIESRGKSDIDQT